jgi:hypothetical protein
MGSTLDGKEITAKSLVGSFHNSLTLLTAELEGRSFGGGVLELVPSEVARLVVPNINLSASEFNKVNDISSKSRDSGEMLISATNALIALKHPEIPQSFFENLEAARTLLLTRRIERV